MSDCSASAASTARESSTLHLGCGEDYRPDAVNVDAVPSVDPDVVLDLEETPWPFEDGRFDRIVAHHVLEHLADQSAILAECARVLEPGGRLEVAVPVGLDATADPDHEHTWSWRTPEFFTGARHWDADLPLTVVEKDVSLWGQLPGRLNDQYGRLLDRLLRHYGPDRWCFAMPATSGEFRVTFRRENA